MAPLPHAQRIISATLRMTCAFAHTMRMLSHAYAHPTLSPALPYTAWHRCTTSAATTCARERRWSVATQDAIWLEVRRRVCSLARDPWTSLMFDVCAPMTARRHRVDVEFARIGERVTRLFKTLDIASGDALSAWYPSLAVRLSLTSLIPDIKRIVMTAFSPVEGHRTS